MDGNAAGMLSHKNGCADNWGGADLIRDCPEVFNHSCVRLEGWCDHRELFPCTKTVMEMGCWITSARMASTVASLPPKLGALLLTIGDSQT
mgnify:CR=1 FL=1